MLTSMAGSAGILGHIVLVNELITSRLEGPFQQAGLTFGTFELLAAVKGGKGRLSQADLAERLGIAAPSLCEAVRTAVRKGLVEQVPSGRDRRVKLVVLTGKGEDAIRVALSEFERLDRELSERFAPAKLKSAGRVLERLAAMLAKQPRS